MGICYPCLAAWNERQRAERRARNPIWRAVCAIATAIGGVVALVVLWAVLVWVQLTGQNWEWGEGERPETLGKTER